MNIRFKDERVYERFCRCAQMSHDQKNSLSRVIERLIRMAPWDWDCWLYLDFDDDSFFFQEKSPEGKNGMCGGIIYHGRHDHGGDGSGPTFSVCLTPCDGYAIHT